MAESQLGGLRLSDQLIWLFVLIISWDCFSLCGNWDRRMLSASPRDTAWRWRECPNCLCFPLAKRPHTGAPPVSHRQDEDLAGLHALPFYRWWIAAADGFLSLKIPVGRAWWIVPDSSSGHTLSDHHCRHQNVSQMWTMCSWLIKYTYEVFFMLSQKSLETSALTKSIASSCVNTNKVGVKNIYTHTHTYTQEGGKKMWAHLLQSLSSNNALSWQTHSSHQSHFQTAANGHDVSVKTSYGSRSF